MRLDEKISKLEATCPGPRLATCEAWIEHLEAKRSELIGVDAKQIKQTLRNREQAHETFTSTSSTSALSQHQPSLPSQVIDQEVLHIDGYTAEHPFPYNSNRAVAYGGGAGASNGSKNNIENGQLPFNSNSMSAKHKTYNHAISVGAFDGQGATRLVPTNDIVAKTPTQDLVNVSTITLKT